MSNQNTSWREAMETSKRVRGQRSLFKVELKGLDMWESRALLADAIEECPDWLSSQDVDGLLVWARGDAACNLTSKGQLAARWLHIAGVVSRRRLGELSPRQRSVLAGLLRGEQVERAA